MNQTPRVRVFSGLALVLALVACGADPGPRLVPRQVLNAAGAPVPLPAYQDTALGRPCEVWDTPAGRRCLPTFPWATVATPSSTCAGPGLVQPDALGDMALRVSLNGLVYLYEPCKAAVPRVNVGPFWASYRSTCTEVPGELPTGLIQVCPADLTVYAEVGR